MGSFSIWHWLIVLAIIILVFGTKRLKNVGKDLGEAVKGFKKGINDGDEDDKPRGQLGDQSRREDGTEAGSGREREHDRDRDRDRH